VSLEWRQGRERRRDGEDAGAGRLENADERSAGAFTSRLEMTVTIDDQCPSSLREHLALNQRRGVRVALQQPATVVVGGSHLSPIDWRIAQQNAQPTRRRQ